MTYESTRLETDEEVQQALRRFRPAERAVAPAAVARQAAPSAEPPPVAPQLSVAASAPSAGADLPTPQASDAPPLFRPTRRPPVPLLTVFDDGSEEGEQIRVRKEVFAIGRSEGDLVIAHDVQMSGRHAELRRSRHKDRYRWQLVDLKSTNGTYVRVGHAILRHGQEFIIGRTRYRFENPAAEAAAEAEPAVKVAQTTQPWREGLSQSLLPVVVELLGEETGSRVKVTGREAWLGTDAANCSIVLRDDPFAGAWHARIRLDDEGRWLIENNKSVNGVWLRIERLALKGTCHFCWANNRSC